VLLLTLHSLCWPDSHKPLTRWPREKKPQWFGWQQRHCRMTTISKLCGLKGIYVPFFPVNY